VSVVTELAAEIGALGVPRVAIDGYDGAGKTQFADEGQKLYVALCDPRSRATVVIDNTDLTAPWRA
jgi:hypothetical protein